MSGKLFQLDKIPSEPIKAEVAQIVQLIAINEILEVYPDTQYLFIGSVGKKKEGEMNGDIDIAIQCDTIQHLSEMIHKVFDYTESVTSESYYIVSIKYPYKDVLDDYKLKYVAIDFMLMHNKEYTAFRYYCPDYRKNESKYKVGAKIMWANTILNHCKERLEGVSVHKGDIGTFRFTPIGLYQSIFNKDSLMFVDSRFVTDNVQRIVNIPFNDGDASHFNSVETLWDAIHSDVFKYPEEVKCLEARLMINSYRKWGIDAIKPEDFKFTYWTYNEIHNMCAQYKAEKEVNKFLDKLQENIRAHSWI